MKLVKGVRYGLTPIKRIYLGYDIVYDTHTFVLQYGHGEFESDVKALLKEEPITNASMIYTVDMYAISAPEIYDGDFVSVNDSSGIISACAVGTFDDIALAASNSKLTNIIKNIIADISTDAKNAVVFGDDGIISVGDINSAQGPMVFGKSIGIGTIIGDGDSATAKTAYSDIHGNPFVIGDGHNSDTVKVCSVDNNICFTVATPDATRFIEIAGCCSRILACLGYGDNKRAVNAYAIDTNVCTTIGDGKNNDTANAEANGIFNAIISAHIGNDSQVFIDSNANLIVETIFDGSSVAPKYSYANSTLNIESTLKVEDVAQSDIHAHGDLHIKTTFGDIEADPVDANAYVKLKTTAKLNPDITQPYKVNLSGVVKSHTKASSMTWHYPEQYGDVLFIFQAYEATYNEETKTLEIK